MRQRSMILLSKGNYRSIAKLIGCFTFLVGPAYLCYHHRQFTKLKAEISQWKNTLRADLINQSNAKELQLFTLTGKLRAMSEVSQSELQAHKNLRKNIEDWLYESNDYRQALRGFSMFSFCARVLEPLGIQFSPQKSIESEEQKLLNYQHNLVLVSQINFVNNTIKRRESGIAQVFMTKCLALSGLSASTLMDSSEEDRNTLTRAQDFAEFVSTSQTRVSEHHIKMLLLNLAAKVARLNDDYEACSTYYQLALTLDNDNPYINQGLIALWGDMAWNLEETSNLKSLLNNEGKSLAYYEQLFSNAQHGLGLTDLSWIYIQSAWNYQKLFPDETQKAVKQKALFERAVVLADRSNSMQREKTVNGYLFAGIARMEQYTRNLTNDKGLLQEALQCFEAGLADDQDRYHPSLLRRKAMVLLELKKNQSDPATVYKATLLAIAELAYRQRHQGLSLDLRKRYAFWQKKLDLSISGMNLDPKRHELLRSINDGNFTRAKRQLDSLFTGEPWTDEINRWLSDKFDIVSNNEHHTEASSDDVYLVPKDHAMLLRQLNISELATPWTFARLNVRTYRAKYTQKDTLLPEWEHRVVSINVDPNWNSESGYLGVAYKNIVTGQWIISHGGTDVTEANDVKTDIEIGIKTRYIKQLDHGRLFTDHVMKEIREITNQRHQRAEKLQQDHFLKTNLPPMLLTPSIYHTGHSLGGFIASFLACTHQGDEGVRAVTFDNPSALPWICHELQVHSIRPMTDSASLPVTAFLTRPSFINALSGPHPGVCYQVPVYINNANTLSDEILKGVYKILKVVFIKKFTQEMFTMLAEGAYSMIKHNIRQHPLQNIYPAFSRDSRVVFNNRSEIQYIEKWPVGRKQWWRYEMHVKDLPDDSEVIDGSLIDLPEDTKAALKESGIYEVTPRYPVQHDHTDMLKLKHMAPGLRSVLSNYIQLREEILSSNDKAAKKQCHKLIFDKITENGRGDQAQLLMLINLDILDGLAQDKDNDALLVNGPLSSWELSAYLQQKIQLAKQAYGVRLKEDAEVETAAVRTLCEGMTKMWDKRTNHPTNEDISNVERNL